MSLSTSPRRGPFPEPQAEPVWEGPARCGRASRVAEEPLSALFGHFVAHFVPHFVETTEFQMTERQSDRQSGMQRVFGLQEGNQLALFLAVSLAFFLPSAAQAAPESAEPKPGSSLQPDWAFHRPARPAPPPVQKKEWVRTPIDQFILARLEQAGLAPSGEAERRVLIRRLSLDLLGLPPSPEEVDRFVSDASSQAY